MTTTGREKPQQREERGERQHWMGRGLRWGRVEEEKEEEEAGIEFKKKKECEKKSSEMSH